MPVDFSNLRLLLDGKNIDRIGNGCPDTSFKFVGHNIDEFLSWDYHINKVISKLGSANYAIARSKYIFPLKIRKTLYNTMFNSQLQFGILSYGCAQKSKF